MDKYGTFKHMIAQAAQEFSTIPKDKTIRLISHLDADGISACSLLVKLLNLEGRKYTLSIIQQLKEETLQELATESYEHIIFSDLASGMVDDIAKILSGKKVFILDHHECTVTQEYPNVVLINPHTVGIDGGKEISGAGVSYLFAQAINKEMEQFAHIAIIGAIGDMQEQNGFASLNNEILQTAIGTGHIKVIRGLRLFGAQTKPLHKVLEYCTDPYIPGVSGSESGVIQFLQQCGIDPKKGSGWKKVADLSQEEMRSMVTGVIMRRLGEGNPEDVLGNVYLLRKEKEGSPTKDAKEFSTLLNACGRLGKASLGIGACVGDQEHKRKAIRALDEYKRHIIDALSWYNQNKDRGNVHQGKGYMIINAGNEILPTIIGTLASIVSRNKDVEDGTYILSLADLEDGSTKVSLRVAGIRDDPSVDLKTTMEELVQDIEQCEAGGHKHAAGAVFPTSSSSAFVQTAHRILGKLAMEEHIS